MIRSALALALVMALSPIAASALAQTRPMTVREFLATANQLPQNATAVLRPEGRRLVDEVSRAVHAVRNEQTAAVAAGRRPAYCIPARGTGITPEGLLARFKALPARRQDISVTQAIREWMVERHPCPA
ncbi:hypothetical protein [Brevundimonas sp.]|uniref:hypothetical protein n=1 Tax=Brevundimonas sp. TaxID=1871086 RepID=UPI002D5DFE44|nr:hypothetical protein [Brevundimonas sp.]HYD27144.1 hypothetical protein [Brevundimonas sp.]